MSLKLSDLTSSMLEAMKPILEKYWKDVGGYAKSEAKKAAETLANIEKLKLAGKINNDQARVLLEMQKHAMRAVFLTVEGLGVIAAQNAINAAMKSVKKLVNDAVGFSLI